MFEPIQRVEEGIYAVVLEILYLRLYLEETASQYSTDHYSSGSDRRHVSPNRQVADHVLRLSKRFLALLRG